MTVKTGGDIGRRNPKVLMDGGWFDRDRVRAVWEDERSGRGGIDLYLTATGNWVVLRWSVYEDQPDTYERVGDDEAYGLMLRLDPKSAGDHFPERFQQDEI